MTVAVPVSDRDEAEPGGQGAIQRGTLVRRPVMGDFHHVDGAHGAGGEQRVLRLLPQVAEEDRTDSAPLDLHGETAGVADIARSPGSRRPEQPPGEFAAQVAGVTGVSLLDRHRRLPEGVQRAFIGLPDRSLDERALRPFGDPGQASDVVRVEVGEHEELQPRDAEPVEARRGGLRLPSDVDHGDRVSVAHQERIALTHVARGDDPVARDGRRAPDPPAGDDAQIPDRPDREQGGRRQRHSARSTAREQEDGRRAERDRAEGSTCGPRRPGQRRAGKAGGDGRHLRDPRRRDPREPQEDLAEPGRPGQHGARQTAQDRRDRRGRLRQEVGGDAVQRKRRRQEDEDGLARQLRRGGNGQGEGE